MLKKSIIYRIFKKLCQYPCSLIRCDFLGILTFNFLFGEYLYIESHFFGVFLISSNFLVKIFHLRTYSISIYIYFPFTFLTICSNKSNSIFS